MRAPANVSMIAVAPDVPSSSQVRRTTINYKSLWGGGSFGRLRIFHLGHMATAVRFRNAPWLRPLGYFVAVVAGLLNGLGNTLVTILSRTFATVRFSIPGDSAPGSR